MYLLSSLLRPIDKKFIEEKLLVLMRYDREKKITNIKKLCHNVKKYRLAGIGKLNLKFLKFTKTSVSTVYHRVRVDVDYRSTLHFWP